jgi:hypothetical protein
MCSIGVASLIGDFLVSLELRACDAFDRGAPVAAPAEQNLETFGSSGSN